MNYAQLLVPDFSLILCGYLVYRYTALNRRVWEQVDNLVYFLLFPVLLCRHQQSPSTEEFLWKQRS
jgi:predicted permease